MPRKFVYQGVTGPTSYKDGQFAADMVEHRADQKRVKRVLRNQKPLEALKSMNKLNEHQKDMQKLRDIQKSKINKYGT
jgi:hypothetical protein|tara:strand:- start:1311 stop:1544 length:234 start_codon:yes stop_codon:yes gene_type:complete